MKVPPLIISLKNIEKKHKKHKKQKKHKNKHKHHHHHAHVNAITNANPPLLEAVELNVNFEEPPPPPLPPPSLPDEPDVPNAPSVLNSSPHPPPPPTLTEPLKDDVPMDISTEAEVPQLQPQPEELEIATAPLQDDVKKEISTEAEVMKDTSTEADVPQLQPQPKILEANAKISFLKMKDDGSITMTIIGPSTEPPEDAKEREMNLEQLCGQLTDGTDVIPSDIDEEECRDMIQVKPVDFVEPSAFGSYLPVQDSTFANITKGDSETLMEIYGDDSTCYEYAKSLQEYAKGTNYLMTMVDSLLDLLTEGKHRKEAVPIRDRLVDEQESKQKEQLEQKQQIEPKEQNVDQKEDLDQKEQIQQKDELEKREENAEASMVQEENKEMEKIELEQKEEKDEVQTQLDEIENLLGELREVQEQRLSASASPIKPGENENKIADEVLSKMTKLIKEKAKPGEISDSTSIFKALGISMAT